MEDPGKVWVACDGREKVPLVLFVEVPGTTGISEEDEPCPGFGKGATVELPMVEFGVTGITEEPLDP